MIHNRENIIAALAFAHPIDKPPLNMNNGDILILSHEQVGLNADISRETLLQWIRVFFEIEEYDANEYEIKKPVFYWAT
jgi:hypothetical protein